MIRINKKLFFGIIGVVTAIAVMTGLISALRAWEFSEGKVSVSYSDALPGLEPGKERPIIYYADSRYVQCENVETWLLMGVDELEGSGRKEGNDRNDQQADLLLLLVVDHANRTCTPIQINRNTMVQLRVPGVGGADAGTVTGPLALAYTYGSGGNDSCRNTVDAVSNFLLGTKIDHYVSLTMDAVAVLNDALGGVTDTVQDTSVLAKAMLQVSPHMVSDCTMAQLMQWARTVGTYRPGDTLVIDGETKNGVEHMEFYANEQALTELILGVLYQKEI